ncbi:MAG: M24 family metallopeptidase [Halobacteriaceae archaeon]
MDEDRRERLEELLLREQCDAVWFARPQNVAWLTGGDVIVSEHADVGVAAAGFDGDGVTVVTSNIERDRLRDEELPGDVLVESYNWYESSLAKAVAERSPTPAVADFDVPGLDRIGPGTASALRQPLSDRDRRRFRAVARDTARAVEVAAAQAHPDDTERELSAVVARELRERGLRAPVLLVGGGERARSHRHFTVADEPLGEYVIVSVNGYRDGLYASATRAVAFDPPRWFERRTRDAARVEATALAATRAVGRDGGTAGDVFEAVRDAYADLGHEGEWRRHHQGGAAGYAGREWKAAPASDEPVTLPMGYAYNPTVEGAKSEGTWLVTADEIENLTVAGSEWPTLRAPAVGYDETLEVPAPLGL